MKLELEIHPDGRVTARVLDAAGAPPVQPPATPPPANPTPTPGPTHPLPTTQFEQHFRNARALFNEGPRGRVLAIHYLDHTGGYKSRLEQRMTVEVLGPLRISYAHWTDPSYHGSYAGAPSDDEWPRMYQMLVAARAQP